MADAEAEGRIVADGAGADVVGKQSSTEGGLLGQAAGEKKSTEVHKPVADEFTRASFTASQKILREQRFLIARARQENQVLRQKITEVSTAGFDQDQNSIGNLTDVAKLAEEAETFTAKIEYEKRRLADTDKQLKEVDEQINEKKELGVKAVTDQGLRKQVQVLQDRLDLHSRRFASQISENKKARWNINELRRERRRFKELMSQVKNRTTSCEKKVSEVVAGSHALLAERGEFAGRIEELQHGVDQEQDEFLAQCRELKQVIRAFDAMEQKLSRGDGVMPDHTGNMTCEQEEELQKKVSKGKWQLDKEKAMTDLLKEQALGFEEAFEKLQVATGFAKIEDFVSHFIQIEELNFHRFQYMHSLNSDIERIEKDVGDLKTEADLSVVDNRGKNDHWQQIKHNTMARVDRLTEHDMHLEKKIEETHELFERLVVTARNICKKIGIQDRELVEDGVEDDADAMTVVIDILGHVETRAIHLAGYAYMLRDEEEHTEGRPAHQQDADADEGQEEAAGEKGIGGTAVAPMYLKPRAPDVRDDDDDEEETEKLEVVPLSTDFLRKRMVGRGEEILRQALAPAELVETNPGHSRMHRRVMGVCAGGTGAGGGTPRVPAGRPQTRNPTPQP
ncbi:hypothetical protein T484DRAFT_2019161 [Baffinella frigidus]|nr:hypothetical protein T484DRAFT_2019161 [Cryptophyta sp. CCMP2293]